MLKSHSKVFHLLGQICDLTGYVSCNSYGVFYGGGLVRWEKGKISNGNGPEDCVICQERSRT